MTHHSSTAAKKAFYLAMLRGIFLDDIPTHRDKHIVIADRQGNIVSKGRTRQEAALKAFDLLQRQAYDLTLDPDP